jgi:hypothetical protein
MDSNKFDRVFNSLEEFVDTISDVLNCPITHTLSYLLKRIKELTTIQLKDPIQ